VEANGNSSSFKKGNSASLSNRSPIFLLKTVPNYFVIHGRISHYLKFKLNSYQHGVIETKSTITNLVTCLDLLPL
jgi:hypothetical protein